MVKEKGSVNIRVVINECDKFTFAQNLGRTERTTKKPRLVVPYAFPSSTAPNCCNPEV
jgi:hypothetical protein